MGKGIKERQEPPGLGLASGLSPRYLTGAHILPGDEVCLQSSSHLTPNITAHGDCTHEIKRRFLLRRKVMTNLDSIFGEGNGTPLQYSCWKILWMEEPGRLQSMGLLRVRYD